MEQDYDLAQLLIASAPTFFDVEATSWDDKAAMYLPHKVPTIVSFCCDHKISKQKLKKLCQAFPDLEEAMEIANTQIERIILEQAMADMVPAGVAIKALQNLCKWDGSGSSSSEIDPDLSPEQIAGAVKAVKAMGL